MFVFRVMLGQPDGVDVAEEVAAADGGDLMLGSQPVESAVEAVAQRAALIASSGAIPGFVGGSGGLTLTMPGISPRLIKVARIAAGSRVAARAAAPVAVSALPPMPSARITAAGLTPFSWR